MVKKKGASVATSATAPKAATAAPKKTVADATAAIVRDAPGDWIASTMTKRDEKKARSLGLISDNESDVILPVATTNPSSPVGVGFVVRKEVNYFNFPMRESVQGWRLKWFYLRDPSTAGCSTCLPKFVDVLEATPKKSWRNILTVKEKVVVDKLYERILEIKNADGQIIIGTEVAAVFLRRRIQPVMSRAHQMWLYSGPKDETRINVAELSEKELLDEVRRLTHFSQEDSIPLLALHEPYDLAHQPAEVPATIKYFPAVSEVEEDPEDAPGTSTAQPPKRPSGGFADEDDLLFDSDEGFAELPSKKAKTSSSRPAHAVSEAPALSVPAASSFPKGKENPLAPGEHSIQAAVTIIKDFASQFTLLQAENARLQQDAQSKSAQLDEAVKIAATARQEADSLKKELGQLKKKLKEEEKNKAETQVQTKEKEDKLRSSSTALLGAANIPADSVGKPPTDSAADAIFTFLAVDSGELVRVLQKNKVVLSRFHAMIFPKANQNKTLGQLVDTFSVDTEGIIKVFKRTSRTYGALLAFQLLMGYGFKADMESLTTELPKDQDGLAIDLSPFSASARKCARQLFDLVEANKSAAGGAAPSLSTQT
ncbi:hypothetical protein ACQ4PT_020418 [Festuca glaucescens]